MSIITCTSTERAVDIPADGFALCCGQRPFAIRWPKKELTSVMCRNPACINSTGVLACDVDIVDKWNTNRKTESM
jgi:hypothetical protein